MEQLEIESNITKEKNEEVAKEKEKLQIKKDEQ